MDKETAKDVGATVVGGGLGLDQMFESIEALTIDGATGSEWVALGRGLALIAFGYLAWRRNRVTVSKTVTVEADAKP